MNTSTSPVVTKSDFHIASPLPGNVPRSGRTSAARCTTAPASSATANVSSVESESMTTTLVDEVGGLHQRLAEPARRPHPRWPPRCGPAPRG